MWLYVSVCIRALWKRLDFYLLFVTDYRVCWREVIRHDSWDRYGADMVMMFS